MSAESKVHALYQKNDRVHVSKQVATSTALPSYIGTVRDVVPCYGDQTVGYSITLDNDPRPARTWFFLQAQLKAVAAERAQAAVDEQ